ncbi:MULTISPECIES: hypothetical protein [unclassified Sphingomonas]|uniref:hypothetical protein n=1 Tax=unclassified Sphingomonas TaxID=196159 RepID=UPI0002EC1CF5|nr:MULTISPECIES: hypothetical protein [unclassified Sphingomonas]KTF67851.1 hypothetical protein ATB93_16145 [Sphingomonas sp. WG]
MNAPTQIQAAHCPYCGNILFQNLKRHKVRGCLTCKRPIVIARSPFGRPRLYRIYSILDVGMAVYALLTIALIAFFLLSGHGVGGFVKGFSIALFIVGSVLCVDGVLALRTARDKTWGRQRRGVAARSVGGGKIAAGVLALFMVFVGVAI